MGHSRMPIYMVGAAAIAVVLVIAGVPFATLFPFALLLACPLMMVFMARGGMHGREDPMRHDSELEPSGNARPPASSDR